MRRQWSSTEKLLFTDTEGTTGVMIEVEGEEARDGDEETVVAVEEVIVLDEGTRGVALPMSLVGLMETF